MTNIDMIQRIFKGAFNFELCSELKQVACYVCYIPYGDDINTICSYDEEEITEEGAIILDKLNKKADDCKKCYFNDWQEKEYEPIKHIIVEFTDEANIALFDKIKGKKGFCLCEADIIEKETLFKLEGKPESKIFYIYFFELDGKLFADYATEEKGSFALTFEPSEASEE